jgi:tetratricopeptide (TPR) repeat protein
VEYFKGVKEKMGKSDFTVTLLNERKEVSLSITHWGKEGKSTSDDSSYKMISKSLRERSNVMDGVFRSSLSGVFGVLCLVLLLVASQVRAEEKTENMDLKALSVQAVQFQQRLEQNPADYEALKGLGIVYHGMALKDSKAYAKKAVQYLEEANQKKSDDTEVLCYLGSAYTLMAKDAGDLMSKSSYMNRGVERMDKAVRMDPDNIVVRLVRANNSKSLPLFLNRRPVAYEDFEYLAGLFEKKPNVSPSLKASVYRDLAALYKEDGDAAKARKYEAMAVAIAKEN